MRLRRMNTSKKAAILLTVKTRASSQMKKLVFTAMASLLLVQLHGSERKKNKHTIASPDIISFRGSKFILKYQVFENHDDAGTAIDTVSHQGDYILFSENGKAYMNYKGRLDSLAYAFPDGQSVTFGDTPFIIANIGNGFYKLVQNEAEPNGDYNRVTYLLKKEEAI